MHKQYKYLHFKLILVAVVGLERTLYMTTEDVVLVEVCAIVYSPNISCPIEFPFSVILSTTNGTAGKYCDEYY